MTHDEVKELIPAYALRALDSMERLKIDEHLKECAHCRGVLMEQEEAAGLLGFTAEPSIPTSRLRARLMEDIGTETNGSGKRATPARPSRRGVLILVAVVVVVAILLFLLPLGLGGGDSAITPLMKQMLASEDLSTQALLPTREIPNASGQVFDPGEGDEVAVFIKGLQDPKGGIYMMWLIVEGQAAPLGRVDIDSAGTAVIHVKKIPNEHEGFLVTLEETEDTRIPGNVVILRSVS